jgi:HK97 family phage prohead protease
LNDAILFDCVTKAAGDNALEFVFSLATPDRIGDIVEPAGWKLANYLKNPVMLWNHDSKSMPIAKATEMGVVNGKLRGRYEFAPEDVNPLGPRVKAAFEKGFLSGVSVGMVPVKFKHLNGRGLHFIEQELVEVSAVPVPAHGETLVVRALGMSLEALRGKRPPTDLEARLARMRGI